MTLHWLQAEASMMLRIHKGSSFHFDYLLISYYHFLLDWENLIDNFIIKIEFLSSEIFSKCILFHSSVENGIDFVHPYSSHDNVSTFDNIFGAPIICGNDSLVVDSQSKNLYKIQENSIIYQIMQSY